MFTITGTRIVGLIAVICAVIVAPQALARPSTHSVNPAADVFERFAAAHTHPALSDRRSPDTRDVADVRQITLADRRSPDTIDIATGVSKELPIQGSHSVNPAADVFERFAAAHTHPALSDRRSPDTRDVADVRQITLADRRSPDTIDIATGVSKELPIQVMTLTRLGQRGSFDWADAGIGATAAALILGLLGGSMLLLHMRPHRRQPAQTT